MSLISHPARKLLLLSALAFLATAPRLRADMMMYQFTGACSDCTGTGTGMLELQNYTPGTPLTSANFVSFWYTSNLFVFSLQSASQVSFFAGSLSPTMPSTSYVEILDTNNPTGYFLSRFDGSWCVGSNCGADKGATSSWMDINLPEPATFTLLLPAMLALTFLRRRRAL